MFRNGIPYSLSAITAPKLATISLSSIASFMVPIRSIVALTICFIAADFVVGVVTSYKVHGKGFESVKAWRTAYKLAGALTCIVAAYGIETLILETDGKFISRGVAGILCGFDFYSMTANFAMLSNHPAFRAIKKFMRSEIEGKINRTSAKVKKENENEDF